MTTGEIECIFFSEFHPTAGPKIVYQVPENYINKEEFDTIHVYIIPKPQLKDRIITIDVLGYKIIGCPVVLDGQQYARNKLMFNLCLVFKSHTDTCRYETIVKKLAGYFTTLENESGFLSNEETKKQMPAILTEISEELNRSGACGIPIDQSTTIHLKVTGGNTDPGTVRNHDVPIPEPRAHYNMHKWDMATLQLLPHIDGFNHVGRIAREANIDINIVKSCLKNLLFYGAIKLISIFQYSNVYMTTPVIDSLLENTRLQEECISYVRRPGQTPSVHHILSLYCGLTAGTTVRDLCARHNPHCYGIDEKKLIQFGLIRGLIRHLQKYPVMLPNESGFSHLRQLYKFFNGNHSYDEICCLTGYSQLELDEHVDNDQSIVICWK